MRLEVVAVGASLGGFNAVRKMLELLPAEPGCSVLVAQHRAVDATSRLTELLARHSRMPVIEPEDKTPLEHNQVYIAPSDYHMLVEPGFVALSIDAPVCHARPSIDVLFESMAEAYGPACAGIVLTGSSEDGAAGAAAVKRAGGRVIVQDPATAESPVGPRAAIARTEVDAVVPLELVTLELFRLFRA